MAVGTCSECGQEKELKDRTICEACRKRIQRAKKSGVIVELKVKDNQAKVVSETPYSGAEAVTPAGGPESPEEWLARRVKETGSKKWQWVKTGNPPGSQPDIKVPQKWELSDIDKAKEYRGQWGEREVESKP